MLLCVGLLNVNEVNMERASDAITLCVQHFGDVQVFLCDVEGEVQVSHRVILNTELRVR